jgi:hypothetical protein
LIPEREVRKNSRRVGESVKSFEKCEKLYFGGRTIYKVPRLRPFVLLIRAVWR